MKIHKKTKNFIGALCVLLAGAGMGVFLVGFLMQAIQQRRDAIDTVRAQGEITAQKVAQQSDLSRKYAFVQENEDALNNVFVRREDLVPTIRKLEELAQISDVTVQLDIQDGVVKKQKSKSVTASTKEGNIAGAVDQNKDKVFFLVEIHGTYAKTVAFFSRLENMQPVASFESIAMKKNDQQNVQKSVGSGSAETNQKGVTESPELITNVTLSFTSLAGL